MMLSGLPKIPSSWTPRKPPYLSYFLFLFLLLFVTKFYRMDCRSSWSDFFFVSLFPTRCFLNFCSLMIKLSKLIHKKIVLFIYIHTHTHPHYPLSYYTFINIHEIVCMYVYTGRHKGRASTQYQQNKVSNKLCLHWFLWFIEFSFAILFVFSGLVSYNTIFFILILHKLILIKKVFNNNKWV